MYKRQVLQANRDSIGEVRHTVRPRRTARLVESVSQDSVGIAVLLYVHGVTDHISSLLSWCGVRLIFKPTKIIQQFLRPVKDVRDPLSLCGVYRVPCSCGHLYNGNMKRSVHARVDEHNCYCHLRQLEKSATAKHALANADHCILYEEIRLLSSMSA